MSALRSFDRLARCYRFLEFFAFGSDLERARFAFLGRLAGRRRILLLGEGDGRCAERLARLLPHASIVCVDSSAGMVERASERTRAFGDRVRFVCADVRDYRPEHAQFDAVTTLFLLDCFGDATVSAIVGQVGASLGPDALWLFADFVLPRNPVARLRARAWIGLLYFFFKWQTGLETSSLPSSERILENAGWKPLERIDLQWGLVRSAVFVRGPCDSNSSTEAR